MAKEPPAGGSQARFNLANYCGVLLDPAALRCWHGPSQRIQLRVRGAVQSAAQQPRIEIGRRICSRRAARPVHRICDRTIGENIGDVFLDRLYFLCPRTRQG